MSEEGYLATVRNLLCKHYKIIFIASVNLLLSYQLFNTGFRNFPWLSGLIIHAMGFGVHEEGPFTVNGQRILVRFVLPASTFACMVSCMTFAVFAFAAIAITAVCVAGSSRPICVFEKLDRRSVHTRQQPKDQYNVVEVTEVKSRTNDVANGWQDMSDSSDTWSLDINTPPETEKSCSSSTCTSPQPIPTGQAKFAKADASETIDAVLASKSATSYAEAAKYGTTTTEQPEPPKPEKRKQAAEAKPNRPLEENTTMPKSKRSLLNHRQHPLPTLSAFTKATQQPDDIVILQVMKGADFRKKLLVRMYKTTTFVHLKKKLKEDDHVWEFDSELMNYNPKDGFPVFDNDTPLSIGLQPLSVLFWGHVSDMPRSLDLTVKTSVESGHLMKSARYGLSRAAELLQKSQ